MAVTYESAGVGMDRGDAFVDRIAPLAKATRIAEVIGDVGGFAGLCRVPAGVDEPVLVSGTDGVGTKLKVAFATGKHDTIGIDLVAMCVNDVLTTGARPLFFLDYFATGHLDPAVGEAVVRGIANGCKQSGCALLGGETAELPGMYAEGEYDLAGFSVGVVARSKIVDGRSLNVSSIVTKIALQASVVGRSVKSSLNQPASTRTRSLRCSRRRATCARWRILRVVDCPAMCRACFRRGSALRSRRCRRELPYFE